MSFTGMTLPMVTCPLCCRPGFSTSDSLCSALVDVTTRKLCCPICNYIVVGLDKFTIHLFSHSLNKCDIELKSPDPEICDSEKTSSAISNEVGIKPPMSCTPNIFKLPSSRSSDTGENKLISIPENSVFCFSGENGQIFTLSSDCMAPSFKNVTINTQNYITNTSIMTSTVQGNVFEKVQKRKYSQVFETDCSDYKVNNENTVSRDYCTPQSVSSSCLPTTSSIITETDNCKNPESSFDKEFESCKDLLTKGDFSTLSDDISELDLKKDSSAVESVSSTSAGDEIEEKSTKKEAFGCDLCPIVLSNKTILAMHKQLIHKKVEAEGENKRKLLDCSMCPRTFSLRSSLMIHRKVAHAGGFGSSDSGSSSKDAQSKYSCSICGKFFKKEIHLTQHMKAHDEKQWQCTICYKTFTTKYFLKKHRRLHTGETPYKCIKCDKAFTFQQSYHKHLLYHNDEKPYCCAQCGRLFKELSTLHNHERIHSGEKPFACETCGKAFRQRVSYLVHRRIHTGAMPYKCTACNKSFRYKISQRTHKCPAQPPGVVIRTSGSLVERLQAAMSKPSEETRDTDGTEMKDEAENNESRENNEVKPSTPLQTMPTIALTQPSPLVPETPKIFEKPQVYLVLKGPNEETYYQPLIISQTVGVQPNPCQAESNPLLQAANTSYVVETLAPTSNNHTSNLKDIQSESNQNPKNITDNKSKTKKQKAPVGEGSSSQLILLDIKNQSDKTKSSTVQNISLEAACLHSPPSSTMDEILKEFNCDELQEPQNTLNNSNISSKNCNNPIADANTDMIAMDSNDIFSFILSPDLTSPSDRLGKLTLSPGSSGDYPEKLDTPGPFKDTLNATSEVQQENINIFDNISEDALKELLFGKPN